ncbi:hypothetical protein [Streptomyces sp. bgisy022]|uniref:hypothetical protein n=1 Tax=Streptomyces sp. bgisy022 TaxID=3413769 RepID=UPI003D75D431
MTRSSHATTRDMAAALKRQAVRAGTSTPAVRGSDWAGAVVTVVHTDGTVDAGDLERVRCMDTYSQPAVGDLIYVTRSSSGNWLAWGRPATAGQTWTVLPVAAGFQNPGHGWTASYLREGARVWLRGRIGATTGTIADGATIATLPAGIRPGVAVSWAVTRDASATPATIRLEITAAGVLRTFQSTALPAWVGLDGITYTI